MKGRAKRLFYATKGVDPRTIEDEGQHELIEYGLRNGLLEEAKPWIRLAKRHILGGNLHPCDTDGIMSGCRLTDAEVFAFTDICEANAAGLLFTGGFDVDHKPSLCAKIDHEYLRGMEFTPNVSLEVDAKGREPILVIKGSLKVQSILRCAHGVVCKRDHAPERVEVKTYKELHALLDIGPTSASRALGMMRLGYPLARWSSKSHLIHLTIPSDEFVAQHDRTRHLES